MNSPQFSQSSQSSQSSQYPYYIYSDEYTTNTSSNESFYSSYNIPPTLLFIIISSLSTALGPFLNRIVTEVYEFISSIYLKYISVLCSRNYNKITLNYITTSNHQGRLHSDISTIVISLLFWMKEHMSNFKDLHSLAHDSSMKEYNQWDEITRSLSIYRINQTNQIKIYEKNGKSLYLRCYDLSEKN